MPTSAGIAGSCEATSGQEMAPAPAAATRLSGRRDQRTHRAPAMPAAESRARQLPKNSPQSASSSPTPR
ncbi:hypothetical protein ACIP8U_21260, partial [Streptomyces pseudovenezuelae]|uniref:hypothetical protein n=1 Tax=Streptomyces pseudovenezuelae TaxID=67350 RepID=UPI0037F5C471